MPKLYKARISSNHRPRGLKQMHHKAPLRRVNLMHGAISRPCVQETWCKSRNQTGTASSWPAAITSTAAVSHEQCVVTAQDACKRASASSLSLLMVGKECSDTHPVGVFGAAAQHAEGHNPSWKQNVCQQTQPQSDAIMLCAALSRVCVAFNALLRDVPMGRIIRVQKHSPRARVLLATCK
jgi:hypothetical protein